MRKDTVYLILNCIRLGMLILLLIYLTSCAIVPKYNIRERQYCVQQDFTYTCEGYLENDDSFERNIEFLTGEEYR